MDEFFYVQICITHLHCNNFMSFMLLYVFDMFHILLSGDSLRDLWNANMCVTRRFIAFQGQNQKCGAVDLFQWTSMAEIFESISVENIKQKEKLNLVSP